MKKSFQKIFLFFSNHSVWIFSLILIFASYLIYFQNLGQMTVRLWDESRNAVNALEMSQSGNLLVTTFDGAPDMWNTKPPLLIWMIAISMKIFGYTEGALRLPSALAATATTFFIFLFVKKYTGDLKIALASSLIMLTSAGYTGMHVARTGDYDAMLTLWITLYSLFYFLFIQNLEKRKHLYLFVTFLILAVLTKGIAGLIPLFGLFIYTLYSRKFKQLLLLTSFYYVLIAFLATILGYYSLRNYFNPGYISAIFANELTGRFTDVNEGHIGGFWFYLTGFAKDRFLPWIFIMPLSLISILTVKNEKLKRLAIFSIFYSLSFLFVISSAKTKLFWYDAPFYPIASILAAVGIISCLNLMIEKLRLLPSLKNFVLYALIVIIFAIPLKKAIIYANTPQNDDADPTTNYSSYLKNFMLQNKKMKKITFIAEGYNAHLLFYAKAANLNGYSIDIKPAAENLDNSKTILTCDQKTSAKMENQYISKPIFSKGSCSAYPIK
jgi:4-amino-4-deoxy-L-arabinose transferase-like glycosyltransferase